MSGKLLAGLLFALICGAALAVGGGAPVDGPPQIAPSFERPAYTGKTTYVTNATYNVGSGSGSSVICSTSTAGMTYVQQ